jgi:hypothetical protein
MPLAFDTGQGVVTHSRGTKMQHDLNRNRILVDIFRVHITAQESSL